MFKKAIWSGRLSPNNHWLIQSMQDHVEQVWRLQDLV